MEKGVWLGEVGAMATTSQKQAPPRQMQLQCGLNTARPRLNITPQDQAPNLFTAGVNILGASCLGIGLWVL